MTFLKAYHFFGTSSPDCLNNLLNKYDASDKAPEALRSRAEQVAIFAKNPTEFIGIVKIKSRLERLLQAAAGAII